MRAVRLPQSRRQLRPRRPDTVPGTQRPTSLCGAGRGGGGGGDRAPSLPGGHHPWTAPRPPPPRALPSAPSADLAAARSRGHSGLCPSALRTEGTARARTPSALIRGAPRGDHPTSPSRLLQGVPRDRVLWTRAKERSAGRRGGRGGGGSGHRSPCPGGSVPLAPRGCEEPRVGRRVRAPWASLTAGSPRTFRGRYSQEGKLRLRRWELAPLVSQSPDGTRSLVGTTGPNFPGSRSPSCDRSQRPCRAGPPRAASAPPSPPRPAGRAPLSGPPAPAPDPPTPGPPTARRRLLTGARALGSRSPRRGRAQPRIPGGAGPGGSRPRGESSWRPRAGAPRAPASRSLSGPPARPTRRREARPEQSAAPAPGGRGGAW